MEGSCFFVFLKKTLLEWNERRVFVISLSTSASQVRWLYFEVNAIAIDGRNDV
jgi:hypothetical protein